jgi:hypothetical protein
VSVGVVFGLLLVAVLGFTKRWIPGMETPDEEAPRE